MSFISQIQFIPKRSSEQQKNGLNSSLILSNLSPQGMIRNRDSNSMSLKEFQLSLGYGEFNVNEDGHVEDTNRLWTQGIQVMIDEQNQTHVQSSESFGIFPHKNQQNQRMQIEEKSQGQQQSNSLKEPVPSPQQNQQKKKSKKNQTKNIPKNYGKAIITFIIKAKKRFIQELNADQQDFDQMIKLIKEMKKKINTIADLRNLWINFKYAKWMRILSFVFLRKHGYSYVYNSRITSRKIHLKHRKRLVEAVKAPQKFIYIKEY